VNSDERTDPDALLKLIEQQARFSKSAKLRIFLGMSAGVGKTYAMLNAANQRLKEGCDVVIGVVETHGRTETAALLKGLPVVPRKKITYRGTSLEEMDLDAILQRKPQLVIVDELAHTNLRGSRHEKRYQDVLEILDAGIDVYSTLNVQHLESRKDSVEAISGISIRETVPDSILERASLVELVDIAPAELLKRLKEGKVYLGDKAQTAAQNFFQEDRLTALREISLRITAERVDQDLQRFGESRSDSKPWQTNERLLVAVSHSPSSEKLIRATRRLAYNLEAPWIAVHVDTGLILCDEDQAQLTKNLKLAHELNAEVINTTEADVPAALKRISRQKNVTQMIVGRPVRRWLRDAIERGSLLDRLVRESQEVDVHVIRQDSFKPKAPPVFEFLRSRPSSSGPAKYLNVAWFIGGVSLLSYLLEALIGYRSVGFLYLLAVMIVGLFSSLAPTVTAAVLSALTWNYFFIPPRMTFVIQQPEDLIMCLAFFVVALFIGLLTNRLRLHQQLIREREERTNVLYEILQDIANSSEKAEFLKKVADRVGALLNAKCGTILKSKTGELVFSGHQVYAPQLDEKEQAVANWTFQNQKEAGWGTDTLSQSRALYLPLVGQIEAVGVFVLEPSFAKRKFNLDQENLLHSITRQLGLSLERRFFEKRLQAADRLHDSEELHQTLLNSISHEMRTPLTAMLGSAYLLGDPSVAQNREQVLSLATGLQDACERLNRVIENLLDMSRLSSGALSLQLEWHHVSDLIGVAVQKLGRTLESHRIQTKIPQDLPFVQMDFRIMEHALTNLLMNAVMYSPEGAKIEISAENLVDRLQIVLADRGVGIPVASLDKIFEKFYRIPGSPPGGTGLGLSIVKSIIELHKGTIRAERRDGGGSRFVIELPLSPSPMLPVDKEVKP
jgi:two-component system sensor histidine kinase KdpD